MEGRLPLQGLRILDLSVLVLGPIAAGILAYLGAEVIKIEKPGEGDPVFNIKANRHRSNLLFDGRNLLYELGNHNKKAIALNLLHPAGQEAFYRLVSKSDALITNLLPQALLRMGADKETVQKHNPNLVYVHGRGYGSRGPEADRPCQDTTGMARSGFSFNQADADGVPVHFNGGLCDVMGATMLAFAAVTALYSRDRTGKAQAASTSQLSSMMWLAQVCVGLSANRGEEYPPFDRNAALNPLVNLYKCADGKWIGMGNSFDKYWHDLCEITGLPHLESDPRFSTNDKRIEHAGDLIAILDHVFLTKPRAEWERLFREKDLLFSIANRYSDLRNDPQVVANEYIVTLDSDVKVVPPPIEVEGVRFPRVGAPCHGQHTEEVLEAVCGYTRDEILNLREEGTIR